MCPKLTVSSVLSIEPWERGCITVVFCINQFRIIIIISCLLKERICFCKTKLLTTYCYCTQGFGNEVYLKTKLLTATVLKGLVMRFSKIKL